MRGFSMDQLLATAVPNSDYTSVDIMAIIGEFPS